MKQYLLFIAGILIFSSIKPQASLAPGGVKGATHWYVTRLSHGVAGFGSQIKGDSLFTPLVNFTSATSSLNFHPALLFSGSSTLPIYLGNNYFNNASFFTVYHSNDTVSESHIWHIRSNNKTSLVLTTKRMADLTSFKYMNYIDMEPKNPKVNIYVQNKEGENLSLERLWVIGGNPVSPQLPITPFKGLVPEIVAYDRTLSRWERLQVSSYLAIKYGITLSEPNATYLNSSGEVLWNGAEYPAYHHNIAGIGRDDSSGLEQKIATSSNNPGLLLISTQQALQNNAFLLWGDNALPLTLDEKIAGLPNLLQKKWLMVTHGTTPITTDIVLDTKQIDAELPATPVYWLAIAKNYRGIFSLPDVEFKKMTMLDSEGKAHFKEVVWNKDSLTNVLGVIAAQDLLLSTLINNPSCNNTAKGSVEARILGGSPPYQLTLTSTSGQLQSRQVNSNNVPESFLGLTTDKYFLRVTDASEKVYSDSFYLNNSDAPRPINVASKYVLLPGGRLEINAAEQMPDGLSYYWTGPDNFVSLSPRVALTRPGLYTLRCDRNGCTTQQDVLVTTPPDNIFANNITVYPNPSGGLFTVKIALDKPANITMQILDEAGKLISSKQLHGFANYRFSHKLTTSGVYNLLFRSGLSTLSKRLIIAR